MTCLHDRHFAHCDIAPKNIFLKKDEDYKAVVGDLGVGHNLRGKAKRMRIVGTKAYMPAAVLQLNGKTVSRSQFRQLHPFWDQYAFAKTAAQMMELLPPRAFIAWREPLQATLKECQRSGVRRRTSSIMERLRWLHPVHRTVAGVPELSHTRTHLLPISPVVVTDRVFELIRHPALLRLSRVKQLTSANQVFPGAQNTRYEHSLGVMETMRRYIMHFISRGDFLTHLSSSKIETALICALLSNLTRLPLATVFDELSASLSWDIFSKDALLKKLFRIRNKERDTIPAIINEKFPNVDVDVVENILLGKRQYFSDEDALIFSLLNCSLDVRVVDYVRRDAHHLGLGRTFDLSELLPHLRVYQHRVALKLTGVSVAEEIINLRYTLYNRIYWNRPNRAYVAMVKYIIKSLATPKFLLELRQEAFESGEEDLIEFLKKTAMARGDVVCRDLAELVSLDRDRLYKVVVEVSPKENSDLSIVCQRVGQMSYQQLLKLAWDLGNVLRLNGRRYLPIIVDMPQESQGNTKLGDDILVITEDEQRSHSLSASPTVGQIEPRSQNLSHVSGIVRGVNESFDGYLRRMRVFVHPEVIPLDFERRETLRLTVINALLQLLA